MKDTPRPSSTVPRYPGMEPGGPAVRHPVPHVRRPEPPPDEETRRYRSAASKRAPRTVNSERAD